MGSWISFLDPETKSFLCQTKSLSCREEIVFRMGNFVRLSYKVLPWVAVYTQHVGLIYHVLIS
jgi:hypothetical protein